MVTNDERQRLTRRFAKQMRELHPSLSADMLDSLSRLATNVAADWIEERAKNADSTDRVISTEESVPAVIREIEQALLEHFPDMPQYSARSVSGDVFEELQEFHEWKVHPFPNHLLPPSMGRGPASPWPGDPKSSHRLGFRLVRVDHLTEGRSE